MCGIAGILGCLDDANRAALSRMEHAIAHRGPDHTGLWTSPPDGDNRGCLFAHRRLSILDLSHAADQPMTDARTGQTLIFNGEIYNYQDLRSQLTSSGERFTSTGDTEVLLRLISLKGPQGLPQLRGMFAFALWHPTKRQLLLARDPLGIKPLYIAQNPDPRGSWSLLFASEVRSILASRLLSSPRLNPAAVASVIWNGFVTAPDTIITGIETLWPGEYRVFNSAGRQLAAETFYSFPGNQQCDGSSTEQSLHHALKESVKLHLASDVPLGVFLSSGIDSSAVANLAQQSSDQPIHTFTLTFEEADYNEGHHAEQIAKAIGTNHREIPLTESRFVENLDRAIDSLDQPTFDGLNSWFMSQAVREAGLTVALVGTGGDELFGGYKTFRDLPKLHRTSTRTRLIPRVAKVLAAQTVSALKSGSGGGAVSPQTRWAKLPDMVRAGEDILALYQLAYALFLPNFQHDLLNAQAEGFSPGSNGFSHHGLSPSFHSRLRAEIVNRSPLSAISILEQRLFLGQRLLRDTDAASMAVSLEVRLPLVDSVLLDHVMRLPDELRYHPLGRKQILRNAALKNLNPDLFERPKSGFVLPFDKWIRRNLGKAMNETMLDGQQCRAVGLNPTAVSRLWQSFQSNAPGMYWSRAWALYILIRWSHRHGVFI